MAKKDLCSALWSQIVQDTKQFANNLFGKISTGPAASSTSRSIYHFQQTPHSNTKVAFSSTESLVNITTTASSSSLVSSNSSIEDLASHYETLWEVQLALGEIPGIFVDNILQPCQTIPTGMASYREPEIYRPYVYSSFAASSGSFSNMSFDESEQIEDYYGDNEDDQYQDDCEVNFEQEDIDSGDDDEREVYEDHHASHIETPFRRNEVAISPLELLTDRHSVAKIKLHGLRHDRRDSGIFVQTEYDNNSDQGNIHPTRSRMPCTISTRSSRTFVAHDEYSDFSDSETEAEEYSNDDYPYGYQWKYSKTVTPSQGQFKSLRAAVMGDDVLRMESGSYSFSPPSLLATSLIVPT
ncbi:hypothetical protein BGZ99_002944 [Dissophora globulifera]|uniref:Uncharacterized protein n=1 Tax=Dissophora globulifera TaxID=979702 RepID=A0A9P6UX12_9FUNG|nr:hypothetical protein BGZ99_002944 [Dissophora globulifera]